MGNIKVERLEKIRQADIINFTGVNNFDDNMELHENLLERVFFGVYDDIFLTEKLEGLSDAEKKEVFELARKYKSLCFYNGDFDYWLDSIEGVSLSDLDLVCIKILDNYDYLLGLAREGGEETLKKLNEIVKTMKIEASAIEYLRNGFDTDELLSKILIDMAKEDSPYNIFSDSEKGSLLTYALGNLYYKEKDGFRVISPAAEKMEIEKRLNPKEYDDELSKELYDMLYKSKPAHDFDHIVSDIQMDYFDSEPGGSGVLSMLRDDSDKKEWKDHVQSPYGENVFLKK